MNDPFTVRVSSRKGGGVGGFAAGGLGGATGVDDVDNDDVVDGAVDDDDDDDDVNWAGFCGWTNSRLGQSGIAWTWIEEHAPMNVACCGDGGLDRSG